MNLTIKDLNIAIDRAIETDAKYFGLAVEVGLPETEIIINSIDNMLNGKLSYYMNAYNNNLELNANTAIKIIGFASGNSFEDIEKKLLN